MGLSYLWNSCVIVVTFFILCLCLTSVCATLRLHWVHRYFGYSVCASLLVAPVSPLHWVSCACVAKLGDLCVLCGLISNFYNNDSDKSKGWRQEEPAILISRLLLRIRRMYVARTQFDHARLDPLSLVIWSCVFWLSLTWNLRQAEWWSKRVLTSIIVAPLRNLWLLLVGTWMLEIVAVNAIYAIAKRSLKKI